MEKKFLIDDQRLLNLLNNEISFEQSRNRRSQFAKVNAGDIVIFNKALLFELLEERITVNKLKIEDLFLLCRAPNGEEGEQLVDTPYGKLRIFFINKPLKSSHLLHRKKYDYPKISKVSTKGSHKTLDEIVKDYTKKDVTTVANEALKQVNHKFIN
jgi:hypothetical protein